MNTDYWFYIENYVHICQIKSKALLYNPYNGTILEYSNTKVTGLIRKMRASRNMGVITLNAGEMADPNIQSFLNDIRQAFMGDILDKKYFPKRPVQMMPSVVIQKKIDQFKKGDTSTVMGENVLDYLSEISIYVNTECTLSCECCRFAFRNFLCCTTVGKPVSELEWPKLFAFLTDVSHSGIVNINILGGNILNYSSFHELKKQLEALAVRKTFWMHYGNIFLKRDQLNNLGLENSELRILVNFPIQDRVFKQVIEFVSQANLKSVIVLLIQNETDYVQAEGLVENFRLDSFEFLPLFNGQNGEFFKENFYLDRDMIKAIRPKLKDIYLNQSLNAIAFGNLTLMADGRLYANVNDAPLGQLGKHSIYDMILKELSQKKSWRLTRKAVFPCGECTYHALCPAISNYNRLMKKFNLCNIRP